MRIVTPFLCSQNSPFYPCYASPAILNIVGGERGGPMNEANSLWYLSLSLIYAGVYIYYPSFHHHH